jgi:phosphoglycolate phosphatase-like HAD superfamily hydrolase
MKATEMLNKVKELVGVEASNEVTLAQATLENGTVIESENFEAGNEVFIITEDEKVALPIGDYTLEDGEMLKVEEEGIISSIGAAEEVKEEESEEVEAAEEEKEEMKYATKEDLAEVKAMIDEIKSMLDPKKEEEKEEMSEDVLEEKVDEVKEELSSVEEPVAKVTHNPETETKKNLNLFAQKRTMTTADRVLQRISNIKK